MTIKHIINVTHRYIITGKSEANNFYKFCLAGIDEDSDLIRDCEEEIEVSKGTYEGYKVDDTIQLSVL